MANFSWKVFLLKIFFEIKKTDAFFNLETKKLMQEAYRKVISMRTFVSNSRKAENDPVVCFLIPVIVENLENMAFMRKRSQHDSSFNNVLETSAGFLFKITQETQPKWGVLCKQFFKRLTQTEVLKQTSFGKFAIHYYRSSKKDNANSSVEIFSKKNWTNTRCNLDATTFEKSSNEKFGQVKWIWSNEKFGIKKFRFELLKLARGKLSSFYGI